MEESWRRMSVTIRTCISMHRRITGENRRERRHSRDPDQSQQQHRQQRRRRREEQEEQRRRQRARRRLECTMRWPADPRTRNPQQPPRLPLQLHQPSLPQLQLPVQPRRWISCAQTRRRRWSPRMFASRSSRSSQKHAGEGSLSSFAQRILYKALARSRIHSIQICLNNEAALWWI